MSRATPPETQGQSAEAIAPAYFTPKHYRAQLAHARRFQLSHAQRSEQPLRPLVALLRHLELPRRDVRALVHVRLLLDLRERAAKAAADPDRYPGYTPEGAERDRWEWVLDMLDEPLWVQEHVNAMLRDPEFLSMLDKRLKTHDVEVLALCSRDTRASEEFRRWARIRASRLHGRQVRSIAARTGTRCRGAGRPRGRRTTPRSSARSGDSGDDGPGEPEPPSRAHLLTAGGAA